MKSPPLSGSLPEALALAGLIALIGGWSSGCGTDVQLPHILLVTADALRADHLSINGYPRETTPHIDRFAQDAVNFEQAITLIPKTGPAFTTLFSGRYPREHGVRYNGVSVPRDLPLLAERLRERGYRTAAFVGNPVLRREMGYARGFDEFREFDRKDDVREVNGAFARWADRDWDEPTFVWIHYLDPHGPYTPPAELEALFINDEWSRSPERVPLDTGENPLRHGQNKVLGVVPHYQRRGSENRRAVYVARYDAEIRLVDEAFGEILHILKDRQLYDGSAVVFTSDHGESLGEHDYYFEHGWFAYEPTLRVPLLIKWPGQTSGEARAGVASLLDLLPTILAISGAPPAAPAGRGVDLRTAPRDRPPLAVESSDNYPVKFAGVRSPDWKYLVSQTDGAEELYDLADDPNEIENLAGRAPPALSELRLVWQHFREETPLAGDVGGPGGARNPTIDEPLDEETRRALEELGYLEPTADP